MGRRLLLGAGRGTRSAAAWAPTDLGANLVAWYKADTGVTGTSPVTAWADQSGNGNNLAVESGYTGPTYSATGLNSKPAITFAIASNHGMNTSGTVAFGAGGAQAVFGILSFSASSTSNSGAFNRGISMFSSGFVDLALAATGSVPQLEAVNNLNVRSTKAASINTSIRAGINADGSTIKTYVDGNAGSSFSGAVTLSNSGFIYITADSASGFGFDGKISELIFVNRALTAGELTNMDTYLTSRQ